MEGDCGIWAFNPADGGVLGVIFAHCPELSEAYLIPMIQIFESIKSEGLGRNVGLPVYGEPPPLAKAVLELWMVQHKKIPEASDLHALAVTTSLPLEHCEYWFSKNFHASQSPSDSSKLEAMEKYLSRTLSYLHSLQDPETSSDAAEITTFVDSEMISPDGAHDDFSTLYDDHTWPEKELDSSKCCTPDG